MQKIQELIGEMALRQKENSFLWMPFFMAIGIGVYFSLKTEPALMPTAIITAATMVLTVSLWRVSLTHEKAKSFLPVLIMVTLITTGFTAAKVRTELAYTPMITKKVQYADIIGTIKNIEPLEKGSRILLKDLAIEEMNVDATPRTVRLTIKQENDLKVGQRVSVLAGLNPPSPPIAPGAFDFQRWSYFQGIGAVGFTYGVPKIVEDQKGDLIRTLRAKIAQRITDQTEKPSQSIILALMTGQRKAIIEEDWEAMRASGLAHMLAISGLHVGMVAGVLFFFSRLLMACIPPLALRAPIKKYAAIFALCGAFFYMMMVGATIPTQRAMIMTALVMLAICLDRSPFSLRLVALAAMIILLYRPESLMSVSFQMSFAAVTSLVAFFEWLRPLWRRAYSRAGVLRKIGLYFLGLSFTTIIAGTVTGLFALYHFQQYAMYGLLANLIAVPILSFIVMPLLVLSYFLMPLHLEGFIFPIADYGVEWILATAHWVAGLSGAVFHLPSYPGWIFAGLVISFWTMIVWKGPEKKFITLPLVILVLFISTHRQPDIQIADSGKLVALRDHQGQLHLSSLQADRFTADNWYQRNAQDETSKLKWPKTTEKDFPLQCDRLGCRGEFNQQKIAISFSNKAWREDCQWADLQISTEPMKNCGAAKQVDYFDIWRQGAHAVWINENDITIRTVKAMRGERPWTQIRSAKN